MVRHKNRYVVVQVNHESKGDDVELDLKPQSLHLAIFDSVQKMHGDFGAAAIRAGFTSKYCNPKTRIAVIRCRHGPHRLVTSSLPFIRKIEDYPVRINMLYTGATIKHCFKFLQKYQQIQYDEFCSSLKTNEEKLAMKEILIDAESVLSMQ